DAGRRRHRRGLSRRSDEERAAFGRPFLRRSQSARVMTFPSDPLDLTVAEARDALQSKALSPLELAEAHIQAIEGARSLNAFITRRPAGAMASAADSERQIIKGEARPREGIPLAIKALFCPKGVRTTAASRILDGFVPTYESTVTQNLWDAGA